VGEGRAVWRTTRPEEVLILPPVPMTQGHPADAVCAEDEDGLVVYATMNIPGSGSAHTAYASTSQFSVVPGGVSAAVARYASLVPS
jgi:hypothetical protein